MTDLKNKAFEGLDKVLTEGFSSASNAFAEMFEIAIEASETTIQITKMQDILNPALAEDFCIGEMQVSGTFDAIGFIAFTPKSAASIARIALDYEDEADIDPEEITDTVYEACNVMINHFIGALSKEYSIHFKFEPPTTSTGSLKDYIDKNPSFSANDNYIALTGCLKSDDEQQTVDGRLFLVFSFEIFSQTVKLKAIA